MTKKVHILKDLQNTTVYAIGIISPDSILQLSMNLNKALGVQFKLNLPIIPTQNTANEFPTSKYSDGEELSCVLVRNKHEGKILFKPYQIADYILFMTEIDNSGFRQTIESGLKNCQSVQTILPIDLNKIKNHSKLVVF